MSLTITTVNVNGIRAAVRQRSEENRGFHQWLRRSSTDVVLMQEVRATEQQTLDALAPAIDAGWHYIGAEASAKGRAGVGILSRFPLADVQVGIPGFEDAGRYIEASLVDAPGEASVSRYPTFASPHCIFLPGLRTLKNRMRSTGSWTSSRISWSRKPPHTRT